MLRTQAVKFWPEPFDLESSKFLANDILRQSLLPTKKLLKLKTTNLEILKFEARFAYIKENKNYNRMKFDTFGK